ncbi:unnamed protein product, partial [Rotaria sp. Silwood2]
EWNETYKMILYPYSGNDYTPRTHNGYVKAAQEAIKKSNGGRKVTVDGIKGISALLEIFSYPSQIVFDYMHLVCLGHVPTLIKRWCKIINKKNVQDIDDQLKQIRLPHNMKVNYLDSITAVDQWKAKNSRLFVLYVGVPICVSHLPPLYASHFVIYSMAIKLLHAPTTGGEIDFANQLIHYYCKTAPLVYDPSIELFSLHAHLHLPTQTAVHHGLAFTYAFSFESCIRHIKKKVHGTKHLASQIAYWTDIECINKTTEFEIPSSAAVNEIQLNHTPIDPYRLILMNLVTIENQQHNDIIFYKRYKDKFITCHTLLYDKPFNCVSYIISFKSDLGVEYGNVILFYKYHDDYFIFVQKYQASNKKMSQFVTIPSEMHQKLDELYPLLTLRTDFTIIPIDSIRHKCIAVPFQDVFCTMAELHEAQKLLGKAMNTDIESDYDPEQENRMKTKTTTIVKLQKKEPTITNLSDVPFGGLGKGCKSVTYNSQSKNVHSALDAGDNLRSLKQTINNYDINAHEDLRSSPQRQHNKRTKATNIKSKRQRTSSKKSTPPNTAISTMSSTFIVDTEQSEYDDDDESDYENKPPPPPRKPSNQTIPSSSSISILQTPKPLAGRKILGTSENNNNDNEQSSQKELVFLLKQSLLSITNIEEKYLKPILIGQERQENMIKMLFENQKKIQRALCKKKMYKNPNDGNCVDLLSIAGVKQKMNLYVTSLIDIVFTREELLQLDANKIKYNDGYKLIQEAVRNKFRLSNDVFNTAWCDLHETFLNKRRDIKKGLKKKKTAIQTNPLTEA